MTRIFISYRHGETSAKARRLYEWLSERYGEERVFLVGALEPGVGRVERIDRALTSSDLVLVVIDHNWLAELERRVDDDDDVVRHEIVAALERQSRIVAVLVDGAAMPSADDLPGPLKALARCPAFELREAHFRLDGQVLLHRIDRFPGIQAAPMVEAAAEPMPAAQPTSSTLPRPRLRKSWFRWLRRPGKSRDSDGVDRAGTRVVRGAGGSIGSIGAGAKRPAAATVGRPAAPDEDAVDCTVFAPPLARPGESILVQVFAHLLEQAPDAQSLAEEFDSEAERRGLKTLEALVRRGTTLVFDLRMTRSTVREPVQSLVWRGRPESVQFEVDVPNDASFGTDIGTMTATLDSVPIGHVKFKLGVTKSTPAHLDPSSKPVGDAKRYANAFVSYSSKDRRKVLERVQMLRSVGIEYFQDLLVLDPGDRWERELYRGIDRCDLFLLFWSSDAKESPWVRKEVQYALDHRRGDEFATPEIRPVLLEGPPVPPPWPELAHLHFGDRFLYLLAGLERS